MTNRVYKYIELTGTSHAGIEDAVQGALARASKTMRGIDWIEVQDIRARVENDKIDHWQVMLKIAFALEE
jgi:flavin-binding protein dodecin